MPVKQKDAYLLQLQKSLLTHAILFKISLRSLHDLLDDLVEDVALGIISHEGSTAYVTVLTATRFDISAIDRASVSGEAVVADDVKVCEKQAGGRGP